MSETFDEQERWLRFELIGGLGVHNSLHHHIFAEAIRIEPLFNGDLAWQEWWSTSTKVPALDMGILVAWPDQERGGADLFPETVTRGRKQHFVRRHIDAGKALALPTHLRHRLLLPTVMDAFGNLIEALKFPPHPTELPADVAPAAWEDT